MLPDATFFSFERVNCFLVILKHKNWFDIWDTDHHFKSACRSSATSPAMTISDRKMNTTQSTATIIMNAGKRLITVIDEWCF